MSEDTTSHGKRSGIDRRDVLKGFAGAAAVASLSGKAFAQAATKEAPDLAKAVADGKLPKLADRVPSSPLVIKVEKVGKYGGALRRGLRGSADHNGILRLVGNQGLVRWNLAFTEVLPNVAEKWTVNANSTEFTFSLRKGMKWSDGKPFTADDIVFSIEDCAKNSELYKSVPSPLVIGGKPGTVTKIDDIDREVHLRRSLRAVPGDDGDAARASTPRCSASTTPASSTPSTTRRSPTSPRRPTSRAGRTCSAPRTATSRSPRAGATRRSRRSIRG